MDCVTIMKCQIMLFVDAYSRYPEAHIFPGHPNGREVAEAIVRKVISRWGTPQTIYCDSVNYQRFGDLPAMCERLGIALRHTSAFNPRANGMAESRCKSVKMLLKTIAFEHPQEWKSMIPLALMVYRCSFNRNTGETPSYLCTGRHCLLPGAFNRAVENLLQDTEVENPNAYAANLARRMRQAYEATDHNLRKSGEILQHQALLPDYFQAGEIVWLFTPRVKTSSSLFKDRWTGPYRIEQVISKVVMLLQNLERPNDRRKAHVSRLKRKL